MENAVLVGAGGFGRCWWPSLVGRPDIRVVAAIEPDPGERAAVSERFKLPAAAVRGPDDAAAWLRLDATAVIDSSPPRFHSDNARRAFAAGLDVLVAKPVAPNLTVARQMASAARSSGRTLAVAQQMRYFPCFQRLRQELASGRHGDVVAVEVSMALDGRRWTPGTDWRLAMADPLLLEAGIHHVDLLRYCLDDEIVEAGASTWNPPWSPFKHDASCAALMRTASGLPITYQATFAPRPGQPPVRFDSGWTVTCSQDVLTVHDGGLRVDDEWVVAPSASPLSLEVLNDALLGDWLAARRTGQEPAFRIEDNLRSMAALQQLIDTATVSSPRTLEMR